MLKFLFNFAKSIRGFLGFSIFIILAIVSIFSWVFSQGAFDQIIANFEKLSKEQFFWLVIVTVVLIWLVFLVLIYLNFKETQFSKSKENLNRTSVIVHEEGDDTVDNDQTDEERTYSPNQSILSFVYDGVEGFEDLCIHLKGTLWNTGDDLISISSVTLNVIDRRGNQQQAAVSRSLTDAIDITTGSETQFTSFFASDKVILIPGKSSESIAIPIRLPRLFRGKIAWVLDFDGSRLGEKIHFRSDLVFITSINDFNSLGLLNVDISSREDIRKKAYGLPHLSDDGYYEYLLRRGIRALQPYDDGFGLLYDMGRFRTDREYIELEILILACSLFPDEPKFAKARETLENLD